MIRTKQEVEQFLNQFGIKFDVWASSIKIAMGQPNDRTICISFHIAEHPINYAFKKEE